jgi:3-carboxy-cis,cis-muconate cycloisomerase
MVEVLEGLQVDEAAMRANLDRSRGLVYSENVSVALARKLGRQAAHELVEKLCEAAVKQGKGLAEVLRADPRASKVLDPASIDALFDPQRSFASAATMIDRALAHWQQSIQT